MILFGLRFLTGTLTYAWVVLGISLNRSSFLKYTIMSLMMKMSFESLSKTGRRLHDEVE